MNWFKNLNATPRLMSSFGVLLVLTLGISYLAISNLGGANDRVDFLYHKDMVGSTHADGITIDVTTIRGDDLNAIYRAADPVAVTTSEKDELATMAELHANLDEADKLFLTKKGVEQLAIIRKALPDYERAQADLFRALKVKDIAAADLALAAAVQNRSIILGASDVARTLKTDHAEEEFQANDQAYRSARTLMLSACAISLVLGIILSIFIARGFSLPLGQAVAVLERVADGDLTVALDVNTKDEVGRMAEALNRALEKLNSNWRRRPRQLLPVRRNRQPVSKRLRPAWRRLPQRCARAQTTPTRPANWHPARRTRHCRGRLWSRMRSLQCRRSTPPRPRSLTSSRRSTKSPSKPIFWR
jgi:methyl-accepting chemotaxis protein